jgi:hypothetical protein
MGNIITEFENDHEIIRYNVGDVVRYDEKFYGCATPGFKYTYDITCDKAGSTLHGYGTVSWMYKDVKYTYSGYIKNNKWSNPGTIDTENYTYTGNMLFDGNSEYDWDYNLHGYGTIKYKTKHIASIYGHIKEIEGSWKYNARHGLSKCKLDNGKIYEILWLDNVIIRGNLITGSEIKDDDWQETTQDALIW